MKRIGLTIVGMIAGTLCWVTVQAQGIDDTRCTQMGSSACVDWEQGIVIAEGVGVPSRRAKSIAQKNASAERAARLDAARNILEMIKGINLSSDSTMQDAMLTNDSIRSQVSGKVHGLRPLGKPHYFSDGSVRIRMEASLTQLVPDVVRAPVEVAAPVDLTHSPAQKSSGKSSSSGSPAIKLSAVYTGLIIDARGTGVQPAMSPKVYDENEKEVYGSAYVDREFVLRYGMAGYVKDLDQAKQNDRIKESPLVLKAVSSSGANHTDLVIANSDADALRQVAKNLNFLKEARVLIVLD